MADKKIKLKDGGVKIEVKAPRHMYEKEFWEEVDKMKKQEMKDRLNDPKVKKALKQMKRRNLAKKAVRKAGKFAGPLGKAAVGALTAYEIIKSIPTSKEKACRTGQYRNKKGLCVDVKGQVRKRPKQ